MSTKKLIVYYSFSGNTKIIAEKLRKATGADIAELETVITYKGEYQDIVNQGQDEVNAGFMPEIKPLGVSLEGYDVIIIGTPTWWYTMAPAVHTFLENNDWSGKTVVPFMTNAGWRGKVIADMKKCCAGAKIKCEKEIKFSADETGKMSTAESELNSWIASVNEL